MRPTILAFLFLLSSSIELTLVLGQFEPCTPGTAPPPVLRPLDNDANYLPMCTPAEDRTKKPATNETTAQQLALCNSFCINRVFSGDFVLNDAAKQTVPGYPTWLLATQSYLLSDQGTTTDCLVGSNSNGCETNCNRFTPPFDFFNPSYGGYLLAQDCKDGCMIQFETPSQTVTACGESCRLSCKSVDCKCPVGFGDGCFGDVAPPCGRDCVASSCQLGCSDANSHLNNNLTYPAAANPNVPPVITQIGFGTRHLINITNSIPSGLSSDVGFSTLIVRVLDLSSTTTNDYTYFVLENGFEFDLAPFTCRRVNISFAVATDQNGVSDYSPATTLEVPDGNDPTPSQLTDFNITEEQDNRPGFVLHHMLHLSWELPENVQFATNYTVTLLSQNNPDVCMTASYTITNTSQTSYTIQSGNSTDPPLTNCLYRIRIEVNPRTGEAAEKTTSSLTYVRPTDNNVNGSCSAVLDRNTISYDVTFYITFDETFTPAVISAISVLRVTRFEIDNPMTANPIPGTVVRVTAPLDSSVEQGPVTVGILYQDLPQLLGGHGYSLAVSVAWNVTGLLSVQIQCETFDVAPIPPDVVEDVSVTFGQAFPRGGQYFVTLQYTWTQPAFQGEGVTGYQVWLDEESPAPEIIQQRLEFSPDSSSGETQAPFTSATSNFILYFQIRAISANTQGPWSQVQLVNVSTLVLPEPNRIEDDQFNVTKFVYSVSDSVESSDNLTITIEVDLQVLAPTVRNGTVEHFQVYVGSERADGLENDLIITRSQIIQFNGGTSYAGISFTNRRIYGFGSTFYLQVRGRSTFEDVESFGEWSSPELLTIQRVPPPEDVWITDFDNVEREVDLVNQQLKVSVRLSFEWIPPLNFAGSVDRYEVILSRQPVGRFSDGSVESMTRQVTQDSYNSTDITFTELPLDTTTFDELTLYIQMRTISNDIIMGGGEWSLPAVNFTLPAQPPTLNDNSFNATSFTYSVSLTSVSDKLLVDVRVGFSFALAGSDRVDIYVGASRLTDQQDNIPTSADTQSNIDVATAQAQVQTFQLRDITEVNGQPIYIQVRLTSSKIVGSWSEPEIRQLTSVHPPQNIDYVPSNSRFRRYVEGTNLVVEAVNLVFTWTPPQPSSDFSVTGYDGLYINQSTSGYTRNPAGQITEFQYPAQSGTITSVKAYFEGKGFDDMVNVSIQMRTRADILTSGSGGFWSDALSIQVPTQPREMTDENFNVTSYTYSVVPSDDSKMLNVSLDLNLLTPAIARGEVKRFHVNVGTDRLTGADTGLYTPVEVKTEGKPQNSTLPPISVPLESMSTLPGTELFIHVRGESNTGTFGDWGAAENFTLPQVNPPENITVGVVSATEDSDLEVSLKVNLQWVSPLASTDDKREKRQTGLDAADDVTTYQVLISTEDSVGTTDYAAAPTGRGFFSQSFEIVNNKNAIQFSGKIQLANKEDIVNNTLYLRMRTVTSQTSAGGEWSDPVELDLQFPPPTSASLTAAIAGSVTPIAIVIVIIIIIILVIIVLLAYRTKRIKDEYKVSTGEVNWDYDWNANMPYISPGMIEGKEPLLDEWEIPTTDVIVEDHLGEGAFGFVFKGVVRGPLRNPKLSSKLKQTIGLPVAIKLLKDTATRKERADFLTEIEMMKKISEGYNNHIVNLVGCVTIQEPLCLITEFVPHGDLLDYLRSQRKKNAAKRRQERLLRMHQVKTDAQREYYEEMIRQAKITSSAQSEDDSGLSRMTSGSGYSELVALRELDSVLGAETNGEPAEAEKETNVDVEPSEGVAVIGCKGMLENSSEMKLLREESVESEGENGVAARALETGVLNPITEVTEEDAYLTDSAAPYLEPKNEYSHLDPKPGELSGQTTPLNAEDEELLRAVLQTEQIGELEANDLMQFAYQIASGMEYLASLNIVHRDLACRNILVGEGKTLKITDFGLSREVEEVYVKKTKGRLPLKWMGIESIDAREFTTASDVWSYGVVLWEIGTLGGFPYPTIPNQELLTMLKQGHRLEKPDNCAPEVYEIMLECWHEDPKDRPTFSQLRSKFSTLLLANVDDPYMTFEVDDAKAYYNVTEEESSEQRESASSDDSDSSLKKKKKGPPKKPVWAKPSNPYVDTPARKEVVITVEEETPQETVENDHYATKEQVGGAGLGVPESETGVFDPYIKMKSSPVKESEEVSAEAQQLPEEVPSQQFVSMSLPVEQSGGISLSALSEEKVVHHPPVKRIRSNPYVDDPGRRQLLDDEAETPNGVESKFPTISENSAVESQIEIREP